MNKKYLQGIDIRKVIMNKPSTNKKYPLSFLLRIFTAFSTICARDGSPALSAGLFTEYCMWEYSNKPVAGKWDKGTEEQ